MKTLFLLTLSFWSLSATAQINVGSYENVKLNPGELSDENLAKLRRSTTVFIYRPSDTLELEALETALTEAWTYSELVFMSWKEYKAATFDDSYSFFTMNGFDNFHFSDPGDATQVNYSNTHLYLLLWMNDKEEKIVFSRVELFPNYATVIGAQAAELTKGGKPSYLYRKALLKNWYAGYLKNAFQTVNASLKKSEERWYFKSEKKPGLKAVATKTLYVPEYVLEVFNKWTGAEFERHDPKKLFAKYDYRYEIIPVEKLSEMILDPDQEIYYLHYIKSSTDVFINVINSKTGEIVYSDYEGTQYNLKSKDIGKLSGAIKRMDR